MGRSEAEGKVTERKDHKRNQPMLLSGRVCVATYVNLLQSLPNMIATLNLHFTQTSNPKTVEALKLYITSTQAKSSHNFRTEEKRII